MEYTTELNGKKLIYGALVENSNFNADEWSAIYSEIVKKKQPDIFENKKYDKDYLDVFGALICLEERYEELLYMLPQEKYSKPGTHPKWVANAVEENTLNKEIVNDDVQDMIDNCENIDELKESLSDYFELK
ncbi:hypothetical protein [Streptococcus uberis]|uniref:hypothetical protein n=1 Tax=Streptococcus uberis TaxID=1349 RepID=UPI001939987F|nr:hypothetical protein [Streptococcus uberis]